MEKRKLRAAAYCRVSTGTDLQDGSFETQCSYYQRRIEEDPALVCAGIYGDQGRSGRSIRSRPALQQLLNDCEEGRIDLILTKSVSRFARNLQECVEMTRRLSDLGVSVRFEREGLDTGSMDGELMLGILAAIAQEESASISSNIQWSRKKHLEKGQPWEKARYGYVSVGKEHVWQVVPREAAIVHRAFCMAALCHSTREIAAEMTRMEALSGSGRIWKKIPVTRLLRSEVYIGQYLSNKECRITDADGNTHRVRNKGYVDQLLIDNHHPPIVSRQLYAVVQDLLDRHIPGRHSGVCTPEEQDLIRQARQVAIQEAERWHIENPTETESNHIYFINSSTKKPK